MTESVKARRAARGPDRSSSSTTTRRSCSVWRAPWRRAASTCASPIRSPKGVELIRQRAAGLRGRRHAARRRQRPRRHRRAVARAPRRARHRADRLRQHRHRRHGREARRRRLSRQAGRCRRRHRRAARPRPATRRRRRKTRCRPTACAGSTSSASTSCATATSRRRRAGSTCTAAPCSASSPSARRSRSRRQRASTSGCLWDGHQFQRFNIVATIIELHSSCCLHLPFHFSPGPFGTGAVQRQPTVRISGDVAFAAPLNICGCFRSCPAIQPSARQRDIAARSASRLRSNP